METTPLFGASMTAGEWSLWFVAFVSLTQGLFATLGLSATVAVAVLRVGAGALCYSVWLLRKTFH
jgi:hypothetical protein